MMKRFFPFAVIGSVVLLFTVILIGVRKGSTEVFVQIKGSDTEVNIVQELTEEFMGNHPDVYLSVTGGGSGTGIAALINGQTDIANSSREMRDVEIEWAYTRGVSPIAIIFAIDGISLITHEALLVKSLTLDEIAGIYRGEITNWAEVGGPDLPVSLYGRQSNSGTYLHFRDKVVKGEYSLDVREMNGSAQIVEAVRNDRAGIGYVGVGYVVDIKGQVISGINVLGVAKDESSVAVTPLNRDNIRLGKYPLIRYLYQYVAGIPEGAVLDFIQFELSPEGQELVAEYGYYPLTAKEMKLNQELGVID